MKKETLSGVVVNAAMRKQVLSLPQNATIDRGISSRIKYKINAFLTMDKNSWSAGVVSKTDLAPSYKHGIDSQVTAKAIMSAPVGTCDQDDFLEDAIHKMIFTDVHRLFVHEKDPRNIVGVLSLTDAARIRSGSCHACVSSRIRVDKLLQISLREFHKIVTRFYSG